METGPHGSLSLLRQTWFEYRRHNAQWLAAALAYFAAFAVAPLLIVLVEIAGFFLHDHRYVLDVIFRYMRQEAGPGSEAVKQIVAATFAQPRQSAFAQIAAWAIFIFAALGLFSALQFALNTVWDADPRGVGFLEAVRTRALGLAMMAGAGLLLLVLVLANTALVAASGYFEKISAELATFVKLAAFAISLVLVWLLFAMLFLVLPDRRIPVREAWIGAGLTALLFTVGQFLLGWYLGRVAASSAYGAAGSLVAFLLWANYTAQIFLFGAEFTRVYAQYRTSRAQGDGGAGVAI
jgi:membrane protein